MFFFEYEIKDNNEIIITNYFGTDTELKIPSEINGKSVTSIGNEAFIYSIGFTSIIIPNSVANIGIGALMGYGSTLKNISVDKENKYFSSEDGILFNKDKSELLCYPCQKKDESYVIPDSVINIREFSFYNCSRLKSVIIPNTVTSIENWAFSGCDDLIIYGYKDSYAETYANEELIQFKDINNQTLNIENPKVNDNTSSQEIETTKTNNSNISIIVILLISIGIIILLWILLIIAKRKNK